MDLGPVRWYVGAAPSPRCCCPTPSLSRVRTLAPYSEGLILVCCVALLCLLFPSCPLRYVRRRIPSWSVGEWEWEGGRQRFCTGAFLRSFRGARASETPKDGGDTD